MNIMPGFKNKKDMITISILIFVVILLFQFVYLPKYREVKKLEAQFKDVAGEINDLYSFIGGRKDLKENIIRIRKELALFEDAFPPEKEVSNIIKQLNKEAQRFKIDVVLVKPKDIFTYKDLQGKEVKVFEGFCKCMPLVLNVEARYQAMGEFLLSLELNRNPMVTIEKVDIKKDTGIAPMVKAEIDLNAFMLGK